MSTALSTESHQLHPLLTHMQWRTIKHPLETVRRFEFETVVLAEHTKKLDPEDPEVRSMMCSL